MHRLNTGYRYGESSSRSHSYSSAYDLQWTVRDTDGKRSTDIQLDTVNEFEFIDRLTGDGKSFFHHHLHGDGNR